jgi:hypothetical protein
MLPSLGLNLPFMHSNHLFPEPSESRCQQCAKYFPGVDFSLMHDWWVYVDEGGSIAAGTSDHHLIATAQRVTDRIRLFVDVEDVAYAIQYAVIYQ